MERINVTRRNGVVYHLNAYDRLVVSAKQVRSLLEDDYVDIELQCPSDPGVSIGDSIWCYGRPYTVNQPPTIRKSGSRDLSYTIRFEGVQYSMARVMFLLNVNTTNQALQDVQGNSLIGDLQTHLSVLLSNLDRVFPGAWSVGEYPAVTASDTLITYDDGENCLSALQKLVDVFESEFDFTESGGMHVINIRERKTIYPYPFKYGYQKGAYEIHRDNSSSDNMVNKLWVYGGNKNLTANYMCDRLLLPNATKSTSFVKDDAKIAQNGLLEGVKIYDDIYPDRKGTVSGISPSKVKFYDDSMFDLNKHWADTTSDYQWYLQLKGLEDSQTVHDNYVQHVVGSTKYLIAGTAATIQFNSGNLAGYDFTISSYNSSTHEFTINSKTDEKGLTLPSDTDSTFQIAEGDTYTISEIMLPQTYITSANQRLLDKANEDLANLCNPTYKYTVKIDEMFMRRRSPNAVVAIDCGDYVNLSDTDFVGSTTRVRVKKVERNLLNRYEYVLELEDLEVFMDRRRRRTVQRLTTNRNGSVFEMFGDVQGDSSGSGGSEANGTTFIPSVSNEGVISWTNDGGLPNPSIVNIMGPQGEQGDSADMVHSTVDHKDGSDLLMEVSNPRTYSRVNVVVNTVVSVKEYNNNEHYILLHNEGASSVTVLIEDEGGGVPIGESEIDVAAGGYTEVSYVYDNNELIITSKQL